jgi:hypothetical protein
MVFASSDVPQHRGVQSSLLLNGGTRCILAHASQSGRMLVPRRQEGFETTSTYAKRRLDALGANKEQAEASQRLGQEAKQSAEDLLSWTVRHLPSPQDNLIGRLVLSD